MNKANKKQLEKMEKTLTKQLSLKKRKKIKRAVDKIFDDYGKTLIRLGRT